jgi:hypothetical protein
MPKYQITSRPRGLSIEVSDAGGKQAAILDALQECKEGRCSCPTPEYDKLAAMDVTVTPDAIQVELTTKPGAELQTQAVRRCLDFTMQRLGET